MSSPGSKGEHSLQKQYKSQRRALDFYKNQVLDYMNPAMQEFVSNRTMVFVATSDSQGECDCSFRAGAPGFIKVLSQDCLAYPEYRGNGVLASLGNILENPHIGLFFADFFESTVGLHVNGEARILENKEILADKESFQELKQAINVKGGQKPERWVLVKVEEAYIHCSKHIPLLKTLDKNIHWGTDNEKQKKGDFFKSKGS